MDELKKAIASEALGFFNSKWLTSLVVEASPVGLGTVLVQEDPKKVEGQRSVAFASRLLSDVERRYSKCEKEALAVVWACERFFLYVFGSKFTIVTDFFSSQPVGQVNCLVKQESNHSETFVGMVVASALPEAVSLEEVVEQSGTEISSLKEWIESGGKEKLQEIAKSFRHVQEELSCTKEGLVLRNSLIIIPKQLREKILKLAHMGHQGILKTKALVRSRVWFPGIDEMVEKMIKKCIECQVNSNKRTYEPLKPSEMPDGHQWEEVSGDFFGPFADGTYWFLNWCDFCRFPEVKLVSSTSAFYVLPALEALFGLLGIPKVYRTDNSPPFNSRAFADFAKLLGFIHRRITPLWLISNGEVERFMQGLGKCLRNASVSGLNKEQELQNYLRVYRETPHSSTQIAPVMLMFGRSRTSGIPSIPLKLYDQLHELARDDD